MEISLCVNNLTFPDGHLWNEHLSPPSLGACFVHIRAGGKNFLPQSMARHDDHIAWFFLEDDPRWNWYIIYVQPKFLTAADKYLIELALEYSGRMKEHWDIFGIGSPFL